MVNKPLTRRLHILLRISNSKLTINTEERTAAGGAVRLSSSCHDGRLGRASGSGRRPAGETTGMRTIGICRALALAGTCLATLAGATARAAGTATPVRHLIVVFQENVSFDHYFATYPNAANPPGEPAFHAAPGTPTVIGLTAALLTRNPNKANPQRLGPHKAATCDMDHDYTPEQQAFDGGLMDKFVEHTAATGQGCAPELVMDYYDGNTVTALWTYAQHFAMSDNSFGTGFGPSTPGALNLVAGNTHGAEPAELKLEDDVITAAGTVIADPDPQLDDCSKPKAGMVTVSGRSVGDLLSAKSVTWGWFQGGFRPTGSRDGKAVCGATSTNIVGKSVGDYSPHHEPFQYYPQTANPHHLPPSSLE